MDGNNSLVNVSIPTDTPHQNNSNGDQQYCLFLTFNTTKIDRVRNVYIVTATLDAVIILPTIVLNILLILSLYRSSEMRKPSSKLLFSLAMSDVLVGLIVEPAFLAKKVGELTHAFSLYCKMAMVTYILGSGLSAISFLNVTAIAIDRYLVVHGGTTYKAIVTNKRVAVLVVAIWSFVTFLVCSQFYTPRFVHFMVSAIISITCLIITSACYIRSFITLKRQQNISKQLFESQQKLETSSNCPYKKSIYTMFYIYVAFLLCYLPYCLTSVCAVLVGDTVESSAIWAAESFSSVAVYTNSLVNPVLLLWRMRNVREAFTRTMSTQYLHRLGQSTRLDTDMTVNKIV